MDAEEEEADKTHMKLGKDMSDQKIGKNENTKKEDIQKEEEHEEMAVMKK